MKCLLRYPGRHLRGARISRGERFHDRKAHHVHVPSPYAQWHAGEGKFEYKGRVDARLGEQSHLRFYVVRLLGLITNRYDTILENTNPVGGMLWCRFWQ